MNIKRSLKSAGKDTSTKAKVLIALLIAIIVLPHLWEAYCSYGWYSPF